MSNVLENIAIWLAVFIFSVATLAFLNLAPPEIKEVGKYVLGLAASNLNSAAINPLGSLDLRASTTTVAAEAPVGPGASAAVSTVKPIRVAIKKIGVDSLILNPESSETAALDNALLSGVVRYPGSGTLEDNLNVFLFGHSSYLPVVNNQSYKAFNRLQELQLGDEIQLFSDSRVYSYKVTKVEVAEASEALVNFSSGKRKVILSTCDSFGEKTDRFVVEATFVESHAIS